MAYSKEYNLPGHYPPEELLKIIGPSSYILCGDYYLSTNPQGTDAWLEERKYRLTASKVGCIIECNKFKTRNELLTEMITQTKEVFSERSRANMARGTTLEPFARQYYMQKMQCTVIERGIAIPKWNLWIGASCDGDVVGTAGIIEIKCPRKMYAGLLEYNQRKENRENVNIEDYVWGPYYCQMQMNMAVLGKKWCDYVVYVPSSEGCQDGCCAIYRINFNLQFWVTELYPAMVQFITEVQAGLAQRNELSIAEQKLALTKVFYWDEIHRSRT